MLASIGGTRPLRVLERVMSSLSLPPLLIRRQLMCSLIGNIVLDIYLGAYYYSTMRIIAKSTLRAFWRRHPDAEEPLLAWYRETEKAAWESPARVKEQYRSASFVGGNLVIFNMKGNDYRLVVRINYPYRVVYVRFVGTHAEYDKIDVGEV